MAFKWPLVKGQYPAYCPVHTDTVMERMVNTRCRLPFGICNLCVKEMMSRLLGEGLHESRQIKKQRREREQRE